LASVVQNDRKLADYPERPGQITTGAS
jgi:hypothetical protein